MSRRITWAVVGTLIALLGMAWWAMSSPHPSSPMVVKPAKQKQALKVSNDLQWQKLSADDIRAMASYFGDEKSPHQFHWQTKVTPGQSVITDCYEGRPGEFVFNRLTPSLKGKHKDWDVLGFDTAVFTMDLSGQQSTIAHFSMGMDMPIGEPRGTLGTMQTKEGLYTIKVEATMHAGDPSISIDTSGGFEKSARGKPPVD